MESNKCLFRCSDVLRKAHNSSNTMTLRDIEGPLGIFGGGLVMAGMEGHDFIYFVMGEWVNRIIHKSNCENA